MQIYQGYILWAISTLIVVKATWEVELSRDQHKFELCSSTYMLDFFQ